MSSPLQVPIVLWQNVLSMHQSAWIRSLATNTQVELIVSSKLDSHRKAMGWSVPDFGDAKITHVANHLEVSAVFNRCHPDAIHVISGFRYPLLLTARDLCIRAKRKVGIFAEGVNNLGVSGPVKFGLYAWYARQLDGYIDFILAAGKQGVAWYRRTGFRKSLLRPFGYFTERAMGVCELAANPRNVGMIYVGQCIYRKGIDILLRSLKGFDAVPWKLKIVGDGEERGRLMRLSLDLGLSDKVQFIDPVRSSLVPGMISESDLLLLPSRFDGWGAVVNEALMVGTPVLCSDRCGSSDLICSEMQGMVFRANSVISLRKQLSIFLAGLNMYRANRSRLMHWSSRIEGATAASYFREVMENVYNGGPETDAPWLGT